MATVTISLPDHIATEVDQAAKTGGFATRSEFIRSLIRRHFSADNQFAPFNSRPLSEIKQNLSATGKYNQKFIDSLIEGLKKSSAYEHKTAQE